MIETAEATAQADKRIAFHVPLSLLMRVLFSLVVLVVLERSKGEPLTLVLQYRPFKETASRPFMTNPAPTKTIHTSALMSGCFLEALHCYKDTNDGCWAS